MVDGGRWRTVRIRHVTLTVVHLSCQLITHFRPSNTMGDMSDLDLVAQAMAPTNVPDKSPPSTTNPTSQSKSQPKETDKDLSSLTPEDLAMLQPILDALNLGDTEDLDDAALHDLIRQMDVAGDVADDLEGKLDRLIGELGKVEEGILADTDKDGKDEKAQSSTENKDGEEKNEEVEGAGDEKRE